MKDKKFLIILLSVALIMSVFVVFTTKGGWFLKKTSEQKMSETGLPESVEKYYQGSATEAPAAPIKDDSDLKALSDEIDSTSVNFDSELTELDKDFASF